MINLLVEGWFNIAHSYSLVACNELVELYRNYGSEINIFICEKEYFRKSWNSKRKLTFSDEKNEIIRSFKVHTNEPIDVVYRITYPYNLSYTKIPTIVFYTAEFASLDPSYFVFGESIKLIDDEYIGKFLETNTNFTFKTPSKWSQLGMNQYVSNERNKIITHGIDTSVFFRDISERERVRNGLGFGKKDIILMVGGALTRNKGIPEVLYLMYLLVIKEKRSDIKLVLKGSSELYPTKQILESYFDELVKGNLMKTTDVNYLNVNVIKYLPNTVTVENLRHLYNAVDLYVSPYSAEGFNLMVLEAISCGTKVLVSKGGCCDDYINKITENVKCSEKYIYTFYTTVITEANNKKYLGIDTMKLYSKFKEIDLGYVCDKYNSELLLFINLHLSWERVAKSLFELIKKCIGKFEYGKSSTNEDEKSEGNVLKG